MIDITRAQANQSTRSGVNSEWTVTLEGEELYKLPSHFTAQETFEMRDIIQKMMGLASNEAREHEKARCDVRLGQYVVAIDWLKAENERLAVILQNHIEVA